ncbi:LacI family DNA-binding transcriptional regulator [Leifsonia sp. Leaf264]|uniref:LacI family DNA-binding transcriptional regulator n=1 Tax=Leifsonia sp. Leaf264 TaxID=1736314 RepID=UPI000A44DFBA|nr:LacI family DNA-binding transcriptional regulator [Leifsonia sp. Leaf264]
MTDQPVVPASVSRPTIADVARRAGVSKGLVSFALNDRPGVNAETRQRILGVAEEMGWTPSVRARSLSIDRSFALGLVIARDPGIVAADPFFPTFISGVESELSEVGQSLVLASTTSQRQEAETYRQLARDKRVDGFFLTDLRADDERISLLQQLGLRAVTLGHPDVASPFPVVSSDDGAGIRAVVAHLIVLGHTRIAHVAGPADMLHATHRRIAFEEAMTEAGLDASRVVETDFSAREGAEATRRLLAVRSSMRPTAIVYSNDPMAIAGIAVARRAGLDVPRDLSVAGFDNTDIAEHVYPSLTSVATDVARWGATAARVLLAAVAGDAIDGRVPLPTRLVIRESTAAAPEAARTPPPSPLQTPSPPASPGTTTV